MVRDRTRVLLPTPRSPAGRPSWPGRTAATRSGSARPRRSGCSPPACAGAAGVARAVAQTHGHEVGWAALPGARQRAAPHRPRRRRDDLPRRVHPRSGSPGRSDGLTDLRAAGARRRRRHVPPGVDGEPVRAGYGLADRPVVVCVSRLVPRKGQDTLIRALPAIRRRVPDAALLLVGGGPYRATLERLARQTGVERDVVFTGSVPWAELPAHYAAGDVFAMPCRTRRGGLDVEGLGIVYLEASATGLPVVAGDSGGAPDAVREGETGYVVRGRDVAAVADRVATCCRPRPGPPDWAPPAGPGWSRSGAGTPTPTGWAACYGRERRHDRPCVHSGTRRADQCPVLRRCA